MKKDEKNLIINSIEKLKNKSILFGSDLEKVEFLYPKDTRKFKYTFKKYLNFERKKIWVENDFYSVSNYILSMIDFLTNRDESKRRLIVRPGDIVYANMHLAHKGESSFIQPVLVLSVHGRNRAFIVPTISNTGYRKKAYHHSKNTKGDDRFYLFTKEESESDKDRVFILTNAQMISTSRFTSQDTSVNIGIKSQTFTDIKELVFKRTHPIEWKKVEDFKKEISKLREEIKRLKRNKK